METSIVLSYKQDLHNGVNHTNITSCFAQGDAGAHRFEIELTDNGTPVSLSGVSVACDVIRDELNTAEDMGTVHQTGTVEGSKVVVKLRQACYAYPGRINIVIRAIDGTGNVTVVFWATGYVTRSTTERVIDPGHEVPSLDELLAKIAQMDAATKAAQNVVNTFDTKYNAFRSDLDSLAAGMGSFKKSAADGYLNNKGTYYGQGSYKSVGTYVTIDKTVTYLYKGIGRSSGMSAVFYNDSKAVVGTWQAETPDVYVTVPVPDAAVYAQFSSMARVDEEVVFDLTVKGSMSERIEATRKGASGELIAALAKLFEPDKSSAMDVHLTTTYGFINERGTVSSAGNQSYNYAPFDVRAGKQYIVHSVLYRLVVPCVFIASDGTVTVPVPSISVDDLTMYEKTVVFVPPADGTLYVNYYKVPISVHLLNDPYSFDKLRTDRLPDMAVDSVLGGKKWAVVGDSFTHGSWEGNTEPHVIVGGQYDGKDATYDYLIGDRCGMSIQHMAVSGRTMGTPADGSFHNCFSDPQSRDNYTQIPSDADYITIYLGINDSHHRPGHTGSDGEDETGLIEMGNIGDTTTATYYGAWNVVLGWIMANRPYAHLGIIVSNGCETDDYRLATIAIANNWGVPYIDLNGDERTPMMHRSTNPAKSAQAVAAKMAAFRVSPTNSHPNVHAHEFESWIIENFLRTL